MELTDILPPERWVELEKEINRMSDLNAIVFNIDGNRITEYKKWANRLCPAIKATDKGQSYICAVAHMNLATQAEKTKKRAIGECDAGLVKIVVPIFVKDEFLGTFGVCGLLLDDGEVDSFLVNMTTGIDETEIENLSNDIDTIPNDKSQHVVIYIKDRIDKIVNDFLSKE